MSFDQNNRRRNIIDKTAGIRSITMGLLYLFLTGFLFFFKREESKEFLGANDAIIMVILGLFAAYGIFRIYRGYKLTKDERS